MGCINRDEFLHEIFASYTHLDDGLSCSMEDTSEDEVKVQTVQVIPSKKLVFEYIHVLRKKFKPQNKYNVMAWLIGQLDNLCKLISIIIFQQLCGLHF